MPLPLLAAAGIGLVPSLFKAISGARQLRKANALNPTDPGYQVNNGVIDNARVLGDRAGNYSMPGYGQAVSQIGAANAGAFNAGVQGASSGGDVLDLATKIAYGQSQQLNNLAVQNAQGADNALTQSLNANAAAGQEYTNKNAYDRDIYQGKLREKAALTQSGNENIYGALDQAAQVGTNLITPKATLAQSNPTLSDNQVKEYYLWKARQGLSTQSLGSSTGSIA